VQFQCSHCKGVVDIDNEDAGQAVACGHCGNVLMAPASPIDENAVIARDFVIQKKIAVGGMGTVYQAHQISLDRSAALKIMHEEYSKNPKFIEDFLREARAAARINHPNIVQAYAVGEFEGLYYFAMEFVEGQSLKEIQKNTPKLPVEQVLQILQDVTRALDFAWKNQRLVHRDIKPDNIIITSNKATKLADLGLARTGNDNNLPEKGNIVFGTPQYISPEQYLNMRCDNRSDIYSLGATAYHLLTGVPPFEGPTYGETAMLHLSISVKPLHKKYPEIPENVSLLVAGMMAKRPDHRYKDDSELLDDIARVMNGGAPKFQVSPLAQVTISLDINEPLNPASIPADVVKRNTPIYITEKDLVTTRRQEEEAARLAALPAPRKKINLVPVLAGLLGLVTLAGIVFAIHNHLNYDFKQVKRQYPTASSVEIKAFIRVRMEIKNNHSEALTDLEHFMAAHPNASKMQDAMLAAAAPLIEERLKPLREAEARKAMDELRTLGNKLRDEQFQRDLKNKINEANPQNNPDRFDPKAHKENVADELRERCRAERDSIRQYSLSFCHRSNFKDAIANKSLLNLQTMQMEPEFLTWARQHRFMLRRAEEMSTYLAKGPGKEIKMEEYSSTKLPAYILKAAKDAKVRNANRIYLADTTESTAKLVIKEPNEANILQPRFQQNYAFQDLPPDIQMYVFRHLLTVNATTREAQQSLTFACYLFSRGEMLDDAKKILEECRDKLKDNDRMLADFIIKQIDTYKPEMQQQVWKLELEDLIVLVAKDRNDHSKTAELRRDALKLRWPIQFDASRDTIEGILKNEITSVP
jgi:serine/threonine protein kinase